jgi:hypothetical protein
MADNSTGNSLFQTWINRALWTVLTGSVSGLLAIHVWVFLAILERPTNIQAEKLVQSYALNEDEVRKMLQREAPYLKDRERILRSLNDIDTRLITAVNDNTTAIVRLNEGIKHLLEVRPAEVLKEVQALSQRIDQFNK